MNPNIEIDVVIATAGSGERMRGIYPEIHKALLPYKNRPILWYIVNNIPETLKIGILLGHKAVQIENFLSIAFPNRKFVYIKVDDWTSEKSGTGYSLLAAKNYTKNSFWYFPCDGTVDDLTFESDFESEIDQILVQQIPSSEARNYAWFQTNMENKLIKKFKESSEAESVLAFTGVMRIKNSNEFFSRLEDSNSNEFVPALSLNAELVEVNGWKDFGSPDKYKRALEESKDFNFAKINEITYELPTKIVKWWSEPLIRLDKLEKPKASPTIYPPGVSMLDPFLYYEKVPGVSLYEAITPSIFRSLLRHLSEELWIGSSEIIERDAQDFYQTKSNERLAKMLGQGIEPLRNLRLINGERVVEWENHWATFDFKAIVENVFVSQIHGDLQFDNVIYNIENREFCLIDWRPNFGSQTVLGDIYYDFAKLLGGIRLDYSQIKKNNFNFTQINPEEACFTIPSAPHARELERVLEEFICDAGYDFLRVTNLVPLIYLNMAPLHDSPFREILWCLFLLGSRNSIE